MRSSLAGFSQCLNGPISRLPQDAHAAGLLGPVSRARHLAVRSGWKGFQKRAAGQSNLMLPKAPTRPARQISLRVLFCACHALNGPEAAAGLPVEAAKAVASFRLCLKRTFFPQVLMLGPGPGGGALAESLSQPPAACSLQPAALTRQQRCLRTCALAGLACWRCATLSKGCNGFSLAFDWWGCVLGSVELRICPGIQPELRFWEMLCAVRQRNKPCNTSCTPDREHLMHLCTRWEDRKKRQRPPPKQSPTPARSSRPCSRHPSLS